jgi:LysR family D-serine deaminase transcriptional activator
LIAPFGEKTLKCHQHYYISTLPGRQWPKIDAFIGWLRELAGEELLRFALHQM